MSLSPCLHGNQRCVAASDIMAELNASSPEQKQESGAVFGRVLFHALQGRCIVSRPLPEESFFLNFTMTYLGTENFTATGRCPSKGGRRAANALKHVLKALFFSPRADLKALMKSLNLGPSLDEDGHDHQSDEHAEHDHDHDHGGLRLTQEGRREQPSADERNTTWDEVYKPKMAVHERQFQ